MFVLPGRRVQVCASVIFVGPVVQSARSRELEICQGSSHSGHRSPVQMLAECRKRVTREFRDRRSAFQDVEFAASLLCVTGAARQSFLFRFRGRHGAFELFVAFGDRRSA